ncbi:OLC1v1004436C1 [Oldenlandia corymbosa var. corymbosa]|uniref:OLC1v1004436C1 n=1 Tax=Oldenlandia corymbosa var. corymbosa TaxID=529605 RepID=A0AAV1DCB0_OLDCO|nr:OLC1v1004436C1 [Oldenlandia corymbosa var. corymbosa]
MAEIVLKVDDEFDYDVPSSSPSCYSATPTCRICHEGELESCKKLETPCSCSGTIQFAHRDCIMRWCIEKGNAVCEICLQKFEPGYVIALPKKEPPVDSQVTIRVSVEIPRGNAMGEEEETQYSECSSTIYTSVSYCRSVALMFTFLLLTRHMLELLYQGTGDYPFTLLTLLILRSVGILLPMYVLLKIITAIQTTINTQQYQV